MAAESAPLALIEAITQALAWELTHDESVLVLGEDVGINGGVFRATAGLQQRFGAERVLDTPLDETTIAGLTVGLAAMQTNFAQTEGIGFLMAQAVFAGLPILILYLFFQRHIVTAVAGGVGK